ncbi:MAG TPA: branched-chain amino acid ABC transporter permease [Burkholderiales bacterium]|nr:branched-chain amino acid ABC transporter permease [Burkholderiales bacterium]
MRTRLVIVVVLLAAACLVPLLGQPYYTKLAVRMAIFALAAMSLDLIVGYAGLVSFGHAAFFGLGCYAAGVLPMVGVQNVPVVFAVAAFAAALIGLVTGAISLRASGLYFIFITLAFAQMVFYVAQGMRPLSGDDGFRLPAPTMLGKLPLTNPNVLLYLMIGILALAAWVSYRLTRSNFGQVVRAARDNPMKLAAIGLPAYPYRLALYTYACALAGIAGAAYANLTEFIAPNTMSWVVSGELLFMVILGTAGMLFGAIIGAVVFVGLEQILSSYTEYWLFPLGVILVLRVLLLKR